MTSTPWTPRTIASAARRAAGEHVDQVDAERAGLEPELPGQRELRVGVDDEHAAAALREQRPDVRCRRRLPDAALLVCDHCDHHETSRLVDVNCADS